MAVTVTHATVTAVPDDPAYDIGSDEWNAAHTVTNALDKTGDTMSGELNVTGTLTGTSGVVEFRQGTTGQALNVFNTYSSGGTNYERGVVGWQSNAFTIGIESGGTGTIRALKVINNADIYIGHPTSTNSSATYIGSGTSSATVAVFGEDVTSGSTASNSLCLAALATVAWNSANYSFWSGNDIGLSRNAAGVLEVNSGTTGTFRDLLARYLATNPTTVAGLPAAAAGNKGWRSFVTDATATTFLSTVVGGGANNVPVVSDGTNWLIG